MYSLDVKPIHPKNGDKYKTPEGLVEFRFGRWVICSNKTLHQLDQGVKI